MNQTPTTDSKALKDLEEQNQGSSKTIYNLGKRYTKICFQAMLRSIKRVPFGHHRFALDSNESER